MYKELKGICKEAIQKQWCLGCSKMELESFGGVNQCKYISKRKKLLQWKYGAIKNRNKKRVGIKPTLYL